jgi:hypothetical protein
VRLHGGEKKKVSADPVGGWNMRVELTTRVIDFDGASDLFSVPRAIAFYHRFRAVIIFFS